MNANAYTRINGRAICARCNTELHIEEVDIEEDVRFSTPRHRQACFTQIIQPCPKCLETLRRIEEANITIQLPEERRK